MPVKNDPRTEVVWFYDKNVTSSGTHDVVSYSDNTCIPGGGEYFEMYVATELTINAWCTNEAVPYAVSNNTWYMGAFVYNGTWQIGYIGANGNLQSSHAEANESAVATYYYIGYGFDGLGNWQGLIANVQFYNSSLSESQISSLYNEGISGSPLSNSRLLAWWPLNGTARDYSGNANNGILANGVVFISDYQAP